MDGVEVYASKTITISVFRYTAQVLTHAVSLMVNEINQFKALCIKQQQIQTALGTFTDLVKAQV